MEGFWRFFDGGFRVGHTYSLTREGGGQGYRHDSESKKKWSVMELVIVSLQLCRVGDLRVRMSTAAPISDLRGTIILSGRPWDQSSSSMLGYNLQLQAP